MLIDAVRRAHEDLPRAQLSKLEVHGFGTSLVESGASFLERVRTEHDVSPRQMRFLMSHQLEDYADNVEPFATIPDSPTDSASTFVKRLATLTGQPLAARLGLSRLAPLIATKWTMRQHSAWCPICVKMATLGERKNYLPLLWSVGCVEVCPIHNILLWTRCQSCGSQISTQWTYEIRFPFHRCPKCRASLYQDSGWFASRSARTNPVQLHVANLVGDLIQQFHTGLWGAELKAPDFRKILEWVRRTGMPAGFCGFIEKANLSKGTGSRLLAGERCSLDVYVRVSVTAGVSLTSLFVPGKLEERRFGNGVTWSRSDAPKRRTADDWPRIVKLAAAELKCVEPCSVNQFCVRHHIDLKLLRSKFGDLAQSLDAAHNTAIALEQQRRATWIANSLIVEAKRMRSAGICISKRALARRLEQERNNKVFISGWKLATATSRQDRLGSKALPLTRHPPRRR